MSEAHVSQSHQVLVTQVPQDNYLGLTRTHTQDIFVGSERQTRLKPHSISTQESSLAFTAPVV